MAFISLCMRRIIAYLGQDRIPLVLIFQGFYYKIKIYDAITINETIFCHHYHDILLKFLFQFVPSS